MAHRAETSATLAVQTADPRELVITDFLEVTKSDVVMVVPPSADTCLRIGPNRPVILGGGLPQRLCSFARALAESLRVGGKLLFFGEVEILPYLHVAVGGSLTFHHWIAVRTLPAASRAGGLPNEHRGLTIYSKGLRTLDHARVRIAYEYCSVCGRTIKDYGGKKHLYDAYGTLMSDVWRDIAVNPRDPLPPEVLARAREMFSVGNNKKMLVIHLEDLSHVEAHPTTPVGLDPLVPDIRKSNALDKGWQFPSIPGNTLFEGDALRVLSKIPDTSVDLAFADPPYNLSKGYRAYADAMEIRSYFRWCDAWLEQLCRVLRPGGALVLINIPQRAMRHFMYLQQRLTFQNWIVWESMSMPVRFIMPSHYPLLLFSKGTKLRALNGSVGGEEEEHLWQAADGYCTRPSCLAQRRRQALDPRKEITDLWSDIHRVKHNSLRADHPCQLPPKLMKRIIALLTDPGDLVLDCFNGVGTTTLCAEQLGRRYIGIEVDAGYHAVALDRHGLLARGQDPFSKRKDTPKEKNNRMPRTKSIKYEVSKKTLQLAVKAVAEGIGHIPSPKELEYLGPYPIRFYEEYFRSWSEVTAAARATGMSEKRCVD